MVNNKVFGVEPVSLAEVDQDFCQNRYGVLPCTAGVKDSGTAQAGSSTTLTLRAGASAVDDAYNGMTARLGDGRERRIAAYVGATKVATMERKWQATYLSLPGTSGNYASTPDSPAVSVTGDIDIRVKARCANWAASGGNRFRFVNKRSAESAYDFYNDGTLGFYNGTTHTATAAHGIPANADKWVRVTRAAASGIVKFYLSDDGVAWTQLGNDVSGPAGNLIDTTDQVRLCWDGVFPFPDGRLYYAEIRNGIDGPVVAKFDPLQAEIDATEIHSATGEIWTINQSGSPKAELLGAPDATTTYNVIDRPNACFNTFKSCQDTANYKILETGTAQGGTSTSLTLRVGATAADDAFAGMVCVLGDSRRNLIITYNGTTKVASMSRRWVTNMISRSEELDHADWTKSNSSVTANAVPTTIGFLDLVKENSATGEHNVNQTKTVTAGLQYVLSGHFKKFGDRDYVVLSISGGASDYGQIRYRFSTGVADVVYDPTGIVVAGSVKADVLADGVVRLSARVIPGSSGSYIYRLGLLNSAGGTANYAGDGNSGAYMSHAQMEQATDLREYLKTPAAAIGNPDSSSTYSIDGTKTLRFTQARQNLDPEWKAIPSMAAVNVQPGQLNFGGQNSSSGALGRRGAATVTLLDHPGSDLWLDPYVESRLYDPLTRGTYWTKWLARNPYFQNRPARLKFGYIGETLDEMQVLSYVIDDIDGPESSGMVSLKFLDVLRLADDTRAQAPALSRGKLVEDLAVNGTSFRVVGAVISDYPGAGEVSIGEEVIAYTSIVDNAGILTFSGLTRGAENSEPDDHDADDVVQRCLRYTSQAAINIIQDLLNVWAGVDLTLLDTVQWATEHDKWLIGLDLATLITKPTGVATLLEEISQQLMIYMYFDERVNKIRLKAIRAPLALPDTYTENKNILVNSQSFKIDSSQRVSQVWVYYNQNNPTKELDDVANYRNAHVLVDVNAESINQYDETRVKKIFSRWFQTQAQVSDFAEHFVQRFKDNAVTGEVSMHAKDRKLWTGDLMFLESKLFTDFTGLAKAKQFHVISARESVPGETLEFELQNMDIIADGVAQYMADNALDYGSRLSDVGAWYSGDDGKMSDGRDGYKYV